MTLSGKAPQLPRNTPPARSALYRKILRAGRGDANDPAIAGMYATWATRGGALPRWMGLPPAMFREMLYEHFGATARYLPCARNGKTVALAPELVDLRHLLLEHRAGQRRSERWVAELVCAGCMGHDHLWSDLGLISRSQLTHLMRSNFPTLAAQNTQNMRWKKFLYKMLCESEGLYICRAPSCEVCSERPICFAPELD
jgi:nitrogen fixation protein NifQ